MFRVYIDEAGDRGHSLGSSTHFLVAAVIVRDVHDAVVRGQLTALRATLGRQPNHTLHFRRLTHSQKLKACQDIAGFDIEAITTVTMVKPRFALPPAEGEAVPYIKQADPMYLFAVRLLLERVSWYVDEHGGGASSARPALGAAIRADAPRRTRRDEPHVRHRASVVHLGSSGSIVSAGGAFLRRLPSSRITRSAAVLMS